MGQFGGSEVAQVDKQVQEVSRTVDSVAIEPRATVGKPPAEAFLRVSIIVKSAACSNAKTNTRRVPKSIRVTAPSGVRTKNRMSRFVRAV